MTVAIRAEVITRGSGKNRAAWEKLCRRSPQSTVFHRPDFLDYHQDRFDERHLGFFRGSELVAVLPMAVRNDQGTSYGTSPYGGSYGGIAADDVLAYAEAFELVDAMIAAVREIGVGRLSIAPPVGRYCAAHSDTLEFCLLDQGFVRDNADVTCGTDLSRGPVAELILARARRHIRKAAKFDVQIVQHAPIEDFWPLLQMTMEKHEAAATQRSRAAVAARRLGRRGLRQWPTGGRDWPYQDQSGSRFCVLHLPRPRSAAHPGIERTNELRDGIGSARGLPMVRLRNQHCKHGPPADQFPVQGGLWGGRLVPPAIQHGILSTYPIVRMMRAGTPATIAPSGTSRVTTAPAPTIALAPIVTPGSTIAPAPSQTSDPT
jgi:hypothetical protein